LPITVREAFELFIGFWKLHPNQATVDMIVKMLEEKYTSFLASERDMFAFYNPTNSHPLSRISNDPTGQCHIVKH